MSVEKINAHVKRIVAFNEERGFGYAGATGALTGILRCIASVSPEAQRVVLLTLDQQEIGMRLLDAERKKLSA